MKEISKQMNLIRFLVKLCCTLNYAAWVVSRNSFVNHPSLPELGMV